MSKLPIKINEKKMPIDNKKRYRVVYDYRKRSSGGFADAVALGLLMSVGFMWILLFLCFR